MMKTALAASALALASAEPMNWVAMKLENEDRVHVNAAMKKGADFRGDYKELALFVSSNTTQLAESLNMPEDRLRVVAEYNADRPLWVAENEREQEVSVNQWTAEAFSMAARTKTMHALDILSNLGITNSMLVESEVVPEEDDFANTQWIPVATKAFKPQPDMMDATLVKALLSSSSKVVADEAANKLVFQEDPRVAAMLALVDADSMRAKLVELTAIFTRLASSQDIYEAVNWIERKYEELNIPGLVVYEDAFNPIYSPNIIADLPSATNPNEWVVIGAHYDSRSTSTTNVALRAPGADDNGSGTVGLLEMARIIAQTGQTFDFGIRFMHFGAEEQGLIGSRAYASRMAQTDPSSILAMFNGDMLGYRIPGTVISLGMKDRSITPWLLDSVNGLSELYVPEINVGLSPSCCSDYLAFFENGFPAVGYFENLGSASSNPDYHRSTDTVETIDFEQQTLLVRAWFAGLATFAVPSGSTPPPTPAP